MNALCVVLKVECSWDVRFFPETHEIEVYGPKSFQTILEFLNRKGLITGAFLVVNDDVFSRLVHLFRSQDSVAFLVDQRNTEEQQQKHCSGKI